MANVLFTEPPENYVLIGTNMTCPGLDKMIQKQNFQACQDQCIRQLDCAGFEYTLTDAATVCTLKKEGFCKDPEHPPEPKPKTVVYQKS